MTTLHLGVIDIPYAVPAGKGHNSKAASSVTTGDVATFLEDKYHVMRIFYELHEADIAKDIESSLQGALETVLMGGSLEVNAFGTGLSKLEDRFKQFLSNREMDRLGYPGVPTKAAMKSVNHRLRHPYAKANRERPSFIDTGQYQASFKAWID